LASAGETRRRKPGRTLSQPSPAEAGSDLTWSAHGLIIAPNVCRDRAGTRHRRTGSMKTKCSPRPRPRRHRRPHRCARPVPSAIMLECSSRFRPKRSAQDSCGFSVLRRGGRAVVCRVERCNGLRRFRTRSRCDDRAADRRLSSPEPAACDWGRAIARVRRVGQAVRRGWARSGSSAWVAMMICHSERTGLGRGVERARYAVGHQAIEHRHSLDGNGPTAAQARDERVGGTLGVHFRAAPNDR